MANSISKGKSLTEEINDIMVQKCSDRTKARKLVKLGLPTHEARLLLSSKAWSLGVYTFGQLTFGVEIECLGFTRNSLIAAASSNNLTVKSENYNHEDHVRPIFKVVSDGSLVGENSQEVVSPVLSGTDGLDSLQKLCDALATVHATVNRSCGLHVHFGASNFSDEMYVRIVKNYQQIEKVVDTFMPLSRRANNSRWCHSLQGIDFSSCKTKDDVARAMNGNRYFKVNGQSIYRHGTIEFRQHSGTVEFAKIKAWVMFLAKLIEYSHKHEISECSRIEDIPFLTDSEKEFFINRRSVLA